jgi:nucleolar protein 56
VPIIFSRLLFPQVLFILYESASGYALFERVESESIVDQLPQVQESISDMGKFSKIVKLRAFLPFTSEKNALEEINSVSEGTTIINRSSNASQRT